MKPRYGYIDRSGSSRWSGLHVLHKVADGRSACGAIKAADSRFARLKNDDTVEDSNLLFDLCGRCRFTRQQGRDLAAYGFGVFAAGNLRDPHA